MTRPLIAQLGIAAGAGVVTAGAALVWVPLGLLVAGVLTIWYFLTVFDVDGDT